MILALSLSNTKVSPCGHFDVCDFEQFLKKSTNSLFLSYSKHLNRRDTHINQHSRQKMIQIKRETHVLINTAQKTVHNNLQHALNNRDTPNLATCLFYKDLEKNTTFVT